MYIHTCMFCLCKIVFGAGHTTIKCTESGGGGGALPDTASGYRAGLWALCEDIPRGLGPTAYLRAAPPPTPPCPVLFPSCRLTLSRFSILRGSRRGSWCAARWQAAQAVAAEAQAEALAGQRQKPLTRRHHQKPLERRRHHQKSWHPQHVFPLICWHAFSIPLCKQFVSTKNIL